MNSSYKIELATYSDIGKTRDRNEDSVFASRDLKLSIVADGMGGHDNGDIASQTAINVFVDTIKELQQKKISLPKDYTEHLTQLEAVLLYCAKKSNEEVYRHSIVNNKDNGMGTTLSALILDKDLGACIHIGDSRIYLLRNEKLTQLTIDHSLLNEQLEKGLIDQSQAQLMDMQNVLTRAIGLNKDLDIDVFRIFPKPGDIYFLCTDGVNKTISDEKIKELLLSYKNHTLARVCKDIIKLANDNGGVDNSTVSILKINPSSK